MRKFISSSECDICFLGNLDFGDYIVEVFETEDCYDGWLYHKGYSPKVLMFGLPKSQCSFEDALDLFIANLDEHIEYYEELYV